MHFKNSLRFRRYFVFCHFSWSTATTATHAAKTAFLRHDLPNRSRQFPRSVSDRALAGKNTFAGTTANDAAVHGQTNNSVLYATAASTFAGEDGDSIMEGPRTTSTPNARTGGGGGSAGSGRGRFRFPDPQPKAEVSNPNLGPNIRDKLIALDNAMKAKSGSKSHLALEKSASNPATFQPALHVPTTATILDPAPTGRRRVKEQQQLQKQQQKPVVEDSSFNTINSQSIDVTNRYSGKPDSFSLSKYSSLSFLILALTPGTTRSMRTRPSTPRGAA